MRQWIVSGALTAGDRLPSEAALADQFGTSRSTVREALRLLSSEDLIATRPGAKGGSTVQQPDAGRITDSLQVSLTLLVGTSDLAPGELLAVREMLEVPSASMAAAQRTDEDVRELRTLIPGAPATMDAGALFCSGSAATGCFRWS
jgi:DNA-binding FadR family transcriptional regulator